MQKIKTIVFDVGGFDETKPNNNVLETIYYTDEELAELEAEAEAEEKAAAEAAAEAAAKEAARLVAEQKLASIGLTKEDLTALGL